MTDGSGPGARRPVPLEIVVERHPQAVLVRLAGELDVSTAGSLRERLRDLMVDGDTHLLLHVRDLTFLDSTGIGTLIGALKLARIYRGSFGLVEAGPRVLRVLQLTGLDHVFAMHPSLEAAGIAQVVVTGASSPTGEQPVVSLS